MKRVISIFLLLYAGCVYAQLPETQLYLFQVQRSPKGYTLTSPKVFGKPKSYTNQPFFSIDGEYLFYVSARDTVNTELYAYNISKRKSKRITKSKEAEYSPKFTPDMEHVSCVRVELDRETQHLATYTRKGKKPSIIWPELKNIGYYDWISQNEFLSFELPEPFVLVKRNIAQKTADTIASRVGRTFYNLRAKGKMVYLDKSDSMNWKIRTVAKENLQRNRKGPKVENPILSDVLPGEEDYCFLQDGSILMGHEGKLYVKKNPFRYTDSTWDEFADLRQFGINSFYRVAISPDNTLLAVVVYTGKKP
jgi:hypothetical protein